MKYFILLFFFLSISSLSFAQIKGDKNLKPLPPKNQVLIGKIIKKPWTKSAESYCAQGSDYYILEPNNPTLKEIVLENQTQADLSAFENKKVKITGFRQIRKIEPSDNPNEQRPVTIDLEGKETTFTCEVFVIKAIK